MLWRDDIETIMVAGGRGFIYIYIYIEIRSEVLGL